MVLPAVPPLPHGRAHLWGRQRLSCACGVGASPGNWESSPLLPALAGPLKGGWGALPATTLICREGLAGSRSRSFP